VKTGKRYKTQLKPDRMVSAGMLHKRLGTVRRNILASTLFIGLLCFLVGGATRAYFTSGSDLEPQEFQLGTVDAIVETEGVGGASVLTAGGPSKVITWHIENTGSQEVWLRALVNEEVRASKLQGDRNVEDSGIEADGNTDSTEDVYSGTPDTSLMVNERWIKGIGGYYYYDQIVYPEEIVDFELTFQVLSPWAGEYDLNIDVQAVQAANNDNGNIKWPN
jgi:hypothetical protein